MNDFFDSRGFMPHGHCFLWKPELLYLHVVSDFLIFLAYMSIPIVLIFVLKKVEFSLVPFRWVLIMFSLFITACGLTHLIGLIAIWHPIYWISGIVKAVTAAVSVATALLSVPLLKVLYSQGKEN